ncbi:MAG: lactate utilization protein B/C [Cryomorphaceae bacterium MED-G14]|nr:MAG: lactate utilization protein B/C [Cryomorphaceae bacterium MED-G14]
MKNFIKFLLGKNKNQHKNKKADDDYKYLPRKDELIEEKFTKKFSDNGGKFLYASNIKECNDFFIKILDENDWNKKNILCFDEKILKDFVNPVKVITNKSNLNSNLLITNCEFLVAKDGSILVSAHQIKSYKIKDIPRNIIVLAKTSQLSETVSKGLEGIRIKYSNNLPSNITSIKNFNCGENEKLNFLTYGTSSKNLYLILLEDL